MKNYSKDPWIFGVCSRIAGWLNINPSWVRWAFVGLSVLTAFAAVPAYLALALSFYVVDKLYKL